MRTMASSSGPAKTDIEAVFHRLRAQSINKVHQILTDHTILFAQAVWFCIPDVFRLQCKKSDMVVGDVWRFYLH